MNNFSSWDFQGYFYRENHRKTTTIKLTESAGYLMLSVSAN